MKLHDSRVTESARKLTLAVTALAIISGLTASTATQARDVSRAPITATTIIVDAATAAMPISFAKNEGQWPDSILFRANIAGATMWLTSNGIYYQFFRKIERASSLSADLSSPMDALDEMTDEFSSVRDSIETTMIKAEFVGASEAVEVVGLHELEYKTNYFIGNDPSKWRSDVPNYGAVTMRGIYPGVDVSFSFVDGKLQEALTAANEIDLAQVKVEYRGSTGVTEQADKLSVVQTRFGERFFDGALLANNQMSSLSTTRARTNGASSASGITMIYSTTFGGGGDDDAKSMAIGPSGSAFVTGMTFSSDFPTLNQNQGTLQSVLGDVFVSKLSSSGSSLVYSTYLGGGDKDIAWDIAVGASGNAFVTGSTQSTDFPTMNPFQTDQLGVDAFVTKLSMNGSILIYSTYLGGGTLEFPNVSEDIGTGIVVDPSGNAYVTGTTRSINFPIVNSSRTAQGGRDVFISKLSSMGSSLKYSTYLGGGGNDIGSAIAIDDNGDAFVTGRTTSSDFPTVNPVQGTFQGGSLGDAFVAKLSANGSSLVYSTYLGGGDSDWGQGLVVDDAGNVFVTGNTSSLDYPTLNPFQTDPGDFSDDAFVTKLSSSGSSLIYSTYLGGANTDVARGIAVDARGNAFVTGWTISSDFPTLKPIQNFLGNGDAFVTKLSASGSVLIYSTYLGGEINDMGNDIAVDVSGDAFVMGNTGSFDFPAFNLNPIDTLNPSFDIFVTKLSFNCCLVPGDFNADGSYNIADVTDGIARIFSGGPEPSCQDEADTNGDNVYNIADITFGITRIFAGGSAPVCGQIGA